MKKNNKKMIKDYDFKMSFVESLIDYTKRRFLDGDEGSHLFLGVKIGDSLLFPSIDLSIIPTYKLRVQMAESFSKIFSDNKEPVEIFGTVLNGYGIRVDKKEMNSISKGLSPSPSQHKDRKEFLIFDIFDFEGNHFLKAYGIERDENNKIKFLDYSPQEKNESILGIINGSFSEDGWISKNNLDKKCEKIEGLAHRAWLAYKFNLLTNNLTENNPVKG
jgi:hypothetical protein